MKLEHLLRDLELAFLFPRLEDRGYIEARCRRSAAPGLKSFPRLEDRGYIEASLIVGPSRLAAGFPRLEDRGYIEAG